MKKNKSEIKFICPLCKIKERIPTYIFEMLDRSDQLGVDTSVPTRFDCEVCPGRMIPVYYIAVNGKIFEYKQ